MGNKFQINKQKILTFLFILSLLLFYQNCSKESAFNSATSLATQCFKKIQSLNLKVLSTQNLLDCQDSTRYLCEVRIFNPDVQNSIEDSQTCLSQNINFCVKTKIRNFNTSKVMDLDHADSSEFEIGGEYNRAEINCSYHQNENDLFLLKAEDTDIESALKLVQQKCLDSLSND